MSSQSLPGREMAVCRKWTEGTNDTARHPSTVDCANGIWSSGNSLGLGLRFLFQVASATRPTRALSLSGVAIQEQSQRCLGPWPSPPSMTSGRSHGVVSGLGTPSCLQQRFLAWQRTGRSDVPASFFDPPIFHRSSALSCSPRRRPVLGPDDGLDGHVFFVVAGTE